MGKWLDDRSGNPVTVLSTELNSLTTTGSGLSGAIDNDADHDVLARAMLDISYASAPTAGTVIDLYLVTQIGGTYEDASTTGPIIPKNGWCASFELRAVTGQQLIASSPFLVPLGDHKYLAVARTTGQTAAASGNTVKVMYYKTGPSA